MADVTISQLPKALSNGSGLIPFSSGNTTLAISTSAIFQNNISNIGIGTDFPQGKLDVNGTLYTKGYNHIESASLAITEATRSRITSTGNGWLEFTTTNSTGNLFISNFNIFEILNTAPNYGLKIKKTGTLKIDIVQDIITAASSGYFFIYILQNGTLRSLTLRKNTGGSWDSINATNILRVNENDIITFHFPPEGPTILNIDAANWSYYNFMFWS